MANPYQAQYAPTDLQVGTTPTGAEVAHWVQNGSSVQLSLSQIFAALSFNIINVKSSPYNAKGDGITDDTGAFTAAIAAAVAQTASLGQLGGTVYVPFGNYVLRTGITLPNYIR